MRFQERHERGFCIHCGKPEDEHHGYEGIFVPAECKCDPNGWLVDRVPDICDAFDDTHKADADQCGKCSHGPECHPTAIARTALTTPERKR